MNSSVGNKVNRVLGAVIQETRAITSGAVEFSHGPTTLEYALTSACNLRCPMCSQALNPPVVRAPAAAANAFLDAVLPHVSSWVPSATSEPLLNDLDLVIGHCTRHRVFVDVITNVTRLTPEVLDRLVPVLHRLTLSLDSCVPAVFEEVRHPAKWAATLPNINHAFQRLRAENIGCVVHAVLMRQTAPHLAELVDFIADRGGCELTVLEQLANTPDADAHDVRHLGAGALAGHMAAMRARAADRGVNLTLRIGGPDAGRFEHRGVPTRVNEALVVDALHAAVARDAAGYCPQVGHYLKVEPDGEAFPCCRGPRELRLGNVYTDGFVGVWNGEPAQALRRQMHAGTPPPVCVDCLVRTEPLRTAGRSSP